MNTAQIIAFREIAAAMGCASKRLSAREMAERSHWLFGGGDYARTKDGKVWTWNEAEKAWVL